MLLSQKQSNDDCGPLLKPDPSSIEHSYLTDAEPHFLTEEKTLFEEQEQ